MLPPYQCLLFCSKHHDRQNGIVLGASASSIYSFSASNGSFLSEWSAVTPERPRKVSQSEVSSKGTGEGNDGEHRQKRRKLSTPGDYSDSTSAEIILDNDGLERRESGALKDPKLSILKLAGTSDGEYVIAVTGEDKCIRVLKLLEEGELQTLSER